MTRTMMKPTVKKNALTIGILAKSSNVNVETIRYYQKMELLAEPAKPKSGFRIYPQAYIDRINFIKRAQLLGFTLKQIRELLTLGDGHCKQVQELAGEKLNEIEIRIKDLKIMRKSLSDLLARCDDTYETNTHCALVEALAQSK